MGFSRQAYWSGPPCPPTGDLPDPGTEPRVSYISCIGRWVLYNQHHLESTLESTLETLGTTMNGPRRTPFTALGSKRLQSSQFLGRRVQRERDPGLRQALRTHPPADPIQHLPKMYKKGAIPTSSPKGRVGDEAILGVRAHPTHTPTHTSTHRARVQLLQDTHHSLARYWLPSTGRLAHKPLPGSISRALPRQAATQLRHS